MLLTFFENRGKNEEQIIERSTENNYTSMKISDFVKEESKFKKKIFLDDYLQKIDKNYVNKIKVDHAIFKCKLCSNDFNFFQTSRMSLSFPGTSSSSSSSISSLYLWFAVVTWLELNVFVSGLIISNVKLFAFWKL